MDANKVLMDYESEADIPDSVDRSSKLRYSILNASVGYMAKVVHNSVKQKPYIGQYCYKTAALTSMFENEVEIFDIHVEQHNGSQIQLNSEQTMFLTVNNGKFGGSRIQLTPVSLLNDGLLDIALQHGPSGISQILRFFKYGIHQKGSHIYRDNYAYFRGRSVKITNKNTQAHNDDLYVPQKFQIDGECLWFNRFVKIEAIPGAVDIIVNYDEMMQQTSMKFKPTL